MPIAYEAGETRAPKKKTPKKKTSTPPRRTTSAGGGSTGLPRGTVAGPSSRLRPARVQPDGTISPRRRRSTGELLRDYRRTHPGPIAMRTADTPWQSERRPRAPGYNPDAPPIVRVGGPTGAAVPRMAAGPAGQALRAGGYVGPTREQLRQARQEPWDSTNAPVRVDASAPLQSRQPRWRVLRDADLGMPGVDPLSPLPRRAKPLGRAKNSGIFVLPSGMVFPFGIEWARTMRGQSAVYRGRTLAASSYTGTPFVGGVGAHIAKPKTGWQSDNAIDIYSPLGTPLYAVADGVIDDPNDRNEGLSFTLNITGNRVWYTHLSKLAVQPGQRVRKGQLVGFSGASDNGAPHLHIATENGNPEDLFGYGRNPWE